MVENDDTVYLNLFLQHLEEALHGKSYGREDNFNP